jgi:hypothetical protein
MLYTTKEIVRKYMKVTTAVTVGNWDYASLLVSLYSFYIFHLFYNGLV